MPALDPDQILRLEGDVVVLLDQRRLPDEVVEVRCAPRTVMFRIASATSVAEASSTSTASSGSRRWSSSTTRGGGPSSSRAIRSGASPSVMAETATSGVRARTWPLQTSSVRAQVPSSQLARYFACSSVSRSMSTPIVASLRRAISASMSAGTG